MGQSIRSLAAQYGVPINKVAEEFENRGIIILSYDYPISEPEKLARYAKIIDGLKIFDYGEKERLERERLEKERREKEGLEKEGLEKERLEKERREKNQRELLSRDYVIFTHMALRKPVSATILFQVADGKINRHTKTKMVVCREALDLVRKAARENSQLSQTVKNLDILERNKMLTILPGRISEENHVISTFIKDQGLNASILIVGVNRSLRSFVKHRNEKNEKDPRYVRIFDKDITSNAHLANPQNQMAAFEDPANKALAPYSEKPIVLQGDIPVCGQYVYYKKDNAMQALLLESEVGKGGEATIYKVFSGTKCAKLFHPESNSELKMKKVALMCSKYEVMKNIDAPIMERIAWPEFMIYNDKEEPVGYVMNLFENVTAFSAFAYDTFEELIPNIEKRHQVTMAVSLAELLDFVHHNNIILCDINGANVLYDHNQLAFLVDLDSAQIADKKYYYPSNVGRPEYLSPEHIYDTSYSFKRKKADDIWILQMLLFHILTPDGNPFSSSRQVNDQREYTAKGYYPYQSGDKGAEKDVRGTIWHIIISHFPSFIKEAFWQSFNGQGKFFKEDQRRDAGYWLNKMVAYQEVLDDLIKNDPESGKYMPTKYKKSIAPNNQVKIKGGNLEDLFKKKWTDI